MNCRLSTPRIVICLFLFVLPATRPALCQQSGPASGEVLTVEQAVTFALGSNRNVKIKSLAVDKAEDQVAAARTSRLPSFNLYVLGSQQLSRIDFRFEKGVFARNLGPSARTT